MVMKTLRKVDSKGRILIPSFVSKKVGIKSGDIVSFEVSRAGNLIVKKEKDENTDVSSLK